MIDMFGHRPPLKVLSIRQPWASLIMSGRKMIENRKWRTDYAASCSFMPQPNGTTDRKQPRGGKIVIAFRAAWCSARSS